ncbi:MAG: 4Fe-4S binding protein [Deltaproteobacteria bacterium]|nr:4Fe-4S binding protein [Deltaproteobacteria bacterium]
MLRVEGEAGNFAVRLLKKPRYVVEEKCTGCGTCAEYCPILIKDESPPVILLIQITASSSTRMSAGSASRYAVPKPSI